MAYTYNLTTEAVHAGNTKHNGVIYHYALGSVAASMQAFASGINVSDYSRISVAVHNHSNASASLAMQVLGNNMSGTSAVAYNGSAWGAIGDPFTVANGASAIKSWETTNSKFLILAGSVSAAISGGIDVDVYLIKHP